MMMMIIMMKIMMKIMIIMMKIMIIMMKIMRMMKLTVFCRHKQLNLSCSCNRPHLQAGNFLTSSQSVNIKLTFRTILCKKRKWNSWKLQKRDDLHDGGSKLKVSLVHLCALSHVDLQVVPAQGPRFKVQVQGLRKGTWSKRTRWSWKTLSPLCQSACSSCNTTKVRSLKLIWRSPTWSASCRPSCPGTSSRSQEEDRCSSTAPSPPCSELYSYTVIDT